MPWTHLHLIQHKELPGPLMLLGPVAFSALWAVGQEAGGLGAGKQLVHPSAALSCLSTG